MFYENIIFQVVWILLSVAFAYENIKRLFMNYAQCSAEIGEAKEWSKTNGSTTAYVLIGVILTVGYIILGFLALRDIVPLLGNSIFVGIILAAKLLNLFMEHMVFEGAMVYTKQQFINDKMHVLMNVALSIFIGIVLLWKIVLKIV